MQLSSSNVMADGHARCKPREFVPGSYQRRTTDIIGAGEIAYGCMMDELLMAPRNDL